MTRRLRDAGKRTLHGLFQLGQRCGVDILPRHFYSEIPDIRSLRADTAWRAPYSMVGVAGIAPPSQLAQLRAWLTPSVLAHLRQTDVHTAACKENGAAGFGRVEADVLFAFVATRRPRQILQIGCGVSTAVCLAAARFAGYSPAITCVEPYPTGFLQRIASQGSIQLVRERAQTLDLGSVDSLDADALFFVDSSHTLGPSGEVSRIILEMLPRLKRGAHVHFHDILFPYDYTRTVLSGAVFFPHESVLLHAFLAYNPRFSVLVSCSMLHYAARSELRELLSNYDPAPDEQGLVRGPGHFPSSTYLQVIA